MINLVIVSKDRPMQANTLLESIKTHCPNLFNINILYTASNKFFQEGFETLANDSHLDDWCDSRFHCHKSGEFKQKLLDIYSDTSYNHVAFATDDTFLFRHAPYELIEERMNDVSVFSLRYGLNTVMQDHFAGRYQPPLSGYSDEGETISWMFSDYNAFNNYGYPFGLDMHVYHREEFVPLCKKIDFDRPTELESGLIRFRNAIKPKIRSFKNSVAVNVPLTNMTGMTQSSEVHIDYLNEKYLKGQKLSYSYKPEDIIGSHQNLEWEIK